MKPCDWCDRETQLTCPECDGTGLVDIEGGGLTEYEAMMISATERLKARYKKKTITPVIEADEVAKFRNPYAQGDDSSV